MGTDLSIRQGLLAANTDYQAKYDELYGHGTMPGLYQQYTEVIPTSAREMSLHWLTNHPRMRKWQGARQHQQLRSYQQTLTFDTWEMTLQLSRTDVEYDTTGAVARAISTTLEGGKNTYDEQAHTEFESNSGAGPTGFDGVALFSTAHPHGPASASTQSNLGSGTNLSHSTLVTAEQTGALLLHENGQPAGVKYNMIRVGPKQKRRVQELISADRVVVIDNDGNMSAPGTDDVVGGATRSSVWQGDMTLVVDERRTNFYTDLLDTSSSARPMVIQQNKFPEAILRIDDTDEARWQRDLYEWALEADFGIHAGHWLSAYRLTGTA